MKMNSPRSRVLILLLGIVILGQNSRQASANTPEYWSSVSAPAPVGKEASPEEIDAALKVELATNPELELTRVHALSASPRVQVDVFKTPLDIEVPQEFIVVRVDGFVRSVHIASTATLEPYRGEKKFTIEGTYPLNVIKVRGKAFPWKRSRTYEDSPMFWGLHIDGGYWIHATPHYAELGRPASMGCIRLNYPTAMELWDLVANQARGDAQITIHRPSSARWALNRLGLNAAGVVELLKEDLRDAHFVTRYDFPGYSHPRRNQQLWHPTCDGVNCFEYFGIQPETPRTLR